jgi:hypothetical protein
MTNIPNFLETYLDLRLATDLLETLTPGNPDHDQARANRDAMIRQAVILLRRLNIGDIWDGGSITEAIQALNQRG